jgi:hypothetical protein
MKRLDQIVLVVSFVGFSWLAMQAIHEMGHVLGALAGGGTVVKVCLLPTEFSRTEVFPNPHPLLEVWAGPVIAAVVPLLAFLLAAALKAPGLYLFRFFAGFCLVVNGVYIGAGSFYGLADSEELLKYGAGFWHLLLFGVLTAPAGLCLWNGLGPAFGFGAAKGRANRGAALTALGLLLVLVGIELVRHWLGAG